MANIQSIITNGNGNVLIGTTTDAGYKLDVNGASRIVGEGDTLTLQKSNSVPALAFIGTSTNKSVIEGGDNFNFYTGGSSRIYINNAGVVGVGTTPNANWTTANNYSATQFRNASLFYRNASAEFYFGNNHYYDGSSWRYLSTTSAALFEMVSDTFSFLSAPSGTAGNAITWTSRLSIQSNGNVLIGTTTNGGYKLDVNGNTNVSGGTITAGSETTYAFRVLQGKPLTLGGDDNYAYIQSWSSGPLALNSQGNNVLIPNINSILSVGTASPYSGMSTRLYVGHPQNSTVNNADQFITVGAGGGSTNKAGINFLIYSAGYGGRIYTDDIIPMGLTFDVLQVGTFYNAMNITRTTSPNVLIGTTTDNGYKLSVNGSGYFNGIGFFENRVASNNSFSDANNVRVLKPLGGSRNSTTPVETGAIKITYPVGYTNTMHRVKFNIYNYQENQAYTVYFGGYNYGPGPSWVNTFAYTITPSGTDFNPTVRFGYDGTYMVVYIGELNWTWSYPQFFIEEVETGFNLASQFATDTWSIGLEASAFQNVTATRSNTQSTNWARNGSVTYNTFGNIGIGTTAPNAKLTIWTPSTTGLQTALRLNNPFGFDNINTGAKIVFSQDRSNAEDFPMGELGVGQGNAASSDFGYMFFSTRQSGAILERMRIVSNGNVLIGTTTDSGFKLNVNGVTYSESIQTAIQGINVSGYGFLTQTISGQMTLLGHNVRSSSSVANEAVVVNASWISSLIKQYYSDGITFHTSTTMYGAGANYPFGDTERMRITPAGNVGIGTTSPSSILHIERSSATNNIIGTPSIIISNQNSTSGTFIGGGIFNNPYRDVSGSSITAGVWFENQNSPDAGAAAKQSAIVFGAQSYATGYNTPSERMRITAAGNVLINSASMDGKLGINTATSVAYNPNAYNGTNASIRLTNGSAGVNRYTGIAFGGGGATEAFIGSVQNSGELAEIVFQTYNGSAYGERMRITSGGRLIIGGTADAGYLLDVHGEILGRDDVRILNTYALVLNGSDDNWRIGRNTITDSGWLTGNTTQIVVSNASSGQGFQVVNSGGTALFEVEGISGYTRISISLGVGVNPSGTTGRIDASNDIVAYSTSDRRLKENINPIPFALDKVKALTGVMFDWKEETKEAHGHSGRDTGIIAQEVQAVLPTAVRTNDTGYLAVRYEKLIGLLIEANKELADQVANQQVQIDELKKLIK
jgi:hypothetical protein